MTSIRWVRSLGVIVALVAVLGVFLAVVGWSVEHGARADRVAEWNTDDWQYGLGLNALDSPALIDPGLVGEELTDDPNRTVSVTATATSLVRVLPAITTPHPYEHALPDLGLGLVGAALVGWIVLLAVKARRFESTERTLR